MNTVSVDTAEDKFKEQKKLFHGSFKLVRRNHRGCGEKKYKSNNRLKKEYYIDC